MAIKLGDKVTDNITGFSGVVMSITEYMHGCRRIGVQATALHDGKPLPWQNFDEQDLTKTPKARSGGPHDAPASRPEGQAR